MKAFAKNWILVFLLALSANVNAQAEMADGMRSEGKIYVVVVMILIVLGGLLTYLFMLDRKLSRLEQQVRERQTKR